MKERITILMPVYNGEKYLSETIDNVLLQTYRDFIFLIINDGSSDRTEKIILSYSDSRIRYLKNETNLGLVESLNTGIELCQTEFLARMDADDLWNPLKLEKQIKFLDQRKDVGICGTSIHKFGAFDTDFIFPADNDGLKVGFLFYCCMSHPSVIFRMSFLRESGIRYRRDYFPAEDYKMWVDCIDMTQIYNIPEPLVRYRQHEDQISSVANATKQMEVQNRVRMEMLERISTKFTTEEKEFHISRFVDGKIESIAGYRKFVRWNTVICQRNSEGGKYIDGVVLRNELHYRLQIFLKGYVLEKFFKQMNLKSLIRYFISFDWIYLSVRRNIGLVKQCILK